MAKPLLQIEDLAICIDPKGRPVFPVRSADLTLHKGKILGLAGESGCGKSMLSLAIMGLLPIRTEVARGNILFEGKSLLPLSSRARRKLRGKDMSMIFQEPMTSLNPVYAIGEQITEAFLSHHRVERSKAKKRALEMMEKTGIPQPDKYYAFYPHQLSGGMRQRVMICIALICRPKLLIADEPTTALDVTIQAQILQLLRELCDSFNTAVVFITHDLGVVASLADEVAVMYAGYVAESAEVKDFFRRPLHPYTNALLKCLPFFNRPGDPLSSISGSVPAADQKIVGCPFENRCQYKEKDCAQKLPPLLSPYRNHRVRCPYHQKLTNAGT